MVNISYEQLKKSLRLEDLFEPIKQAFIAYNSSKVIGIPVSLLHFPNNADTHIKTAAMKGYDYFSVKVVSMFPENTKLSLTPASGAIFLFDAHTGFPSAIINDKGFITDLRTAVAGALITDCIAPKSATTVTVIGTGIQAFYQVLALTKKRAITQLTIYGRNHEKALLLKEKIRASIPNLKVAVVSSIEASVKSSQIIITTTSSKTALLKGKWFVKGQHITAIGADDVYKNEIDQDCFNDADQIYVDSLELNKRYGEYALAIKNNPHILNKTIEFGDVFQTKNFNSENKMTVSKLVGVGIQDLAVSCKVLNDLKNT